MPEVTMSWLTRHAALISACLLACAGCAGRYDVARANHYDGADATRPARKLVMVVDARNEYGASDEQIRGCVGRAVRCGAEAVVVPWRPSTGERRGGAGALPADEVVRIAREQGGDAACAVDVSDCGWSFAILALPPAWSLANQLRYSVRVFDVASGRLVMQSSRTRRNGGVLATYVPHLLPQLESGVREDLRPWIRAEGT
jgi:hypothetical protein